MKEKTIIKPWCFTRKEIQQLLYWACIGVAKSKGGMYEKTVPILIKQIAKEIKFYVNLPFRPVEFNAKWKKWKRGYKREKHDEKYKEI